MRILLFPMGSAGDVHPFIGLGGALQTRGHEVFVITNGYYADSVRAAGLEFVELGTAEEFKRITDDPNLWHPKRAFGTIIEKGVNLTYGPALQAARELHKPGETVMAAGTLGIAARNVRDKLDIPLATVHLAPGIFLSAHHMPRLHGAPVPQWAPRWLKALQWEMASRITDKVVLPGLNAFRREQDLPPARHVIREWWHSPDRVIGLFPDWFGPPQPDWPAQTRLTGFPLFDQMEMQAMPPDLAAWLEDGDPPVVFTPGSAMAHGGRFFHEAVKAMQMLGRRALLLTQYPELARQRLPLELVEVVAHLTEEAPDRGLGHPRLHADPAHVVVGRFDVERLEAEAARQDLERIAGGTGLVHHNRGGGALLGGDLVLVRPASVVRHRAPAEERVVEHGVAGHGDRGVVHQHDDRLPGHVHVLVVVPAVFGSDHAVADEHELAVLDPDLGRHAPGLRDEVAHPLERDAAPPDRERGGHLG
jgi:UDP:flavonoid glycosyltransferase YjiC (YdhE family)